MGRNQRAPSHLPSRRESGFTLVELLIVVVIFSIVAALAMPAVDPDRARATSALLAVSGAFQTAQREAVARQYDVIVSIDTAERRVVLIWDANNNGVLDGGERQRVVSLERNVAFGRSTAPAMAFGAGNITFAAGPTGFPSVTFRRSGSASSAGGLYVTSSKAAAGNARRVTDARAIEIIRATGRVEWFRYDGTAWRRGF